MISTNIPEEILELELQLPNEFEIYKDSLPKEPTDPDAKKEYCVGCYSADDWHFVHEILMQDGTLEDNIPDHSCECVNDCLHSPTRGIYLLTDSEAEELRNSPRVQYVNINTGKYPGTYLRNPKDLIASGEIQQQRYLSDVNNQRYFPYTTYLPDSYAVTTTYPEISRYFIVGIETNTASTAYRTTATFSHRGGSISSTTDNPSFELESGDYFVIVNYEGTNDPIKIQTTAGIGGNAYNYYDLTYSSSGGIQVVRWYAETPGTYYYQSENTSTAVGTITVSARDTVDSSLKNRSGYQFLRHKEQQDPWSYATFTSVISDSISQRGDGSDVDVIVADTMAWFGHIEFQNNLGGPKGYRGGNVLPGNGTCDLLDLVLDAPYYLDPDFFNANPSKLTTRWDGTIVPTDSAAHNWWENNSTSHRSAKFVSPANGGTATGDNDFGIVGSISDSYLRQYAGTHTERNYGDEHGTACASQTYGRQYGWAYNANKWYINLYGTFASDIEIGFDIQKIFHKIKPINPEYGTRNPTISSNSWRIPNPPPTTGYYYYRSGDTGSNGVAFNVSNWYSGGTPEFITNHYYTTIQSEMVANSLLTAGNELVDAGVICVCAAGNENQKLVKADHPDYNNYHSSSNNTALASATHGGDTYLNTINRAGMPLQIGHIGSGTNKVYKTICVGALDDYYNSSTNRKESKVSYSNRGNLIDIFMAADGTVAAGAPTYGSYDYFRYIRPDQYYTINGVTSRPSFDVRFSGTSSATPIFAGLLATKLQYQRDWTYAEVKEWISSLGEMDPNDFYYGTESTTVDDSNWSDDYSLEGAPAIVGWDKPTKTYYDKISLYGNLNLGGDLKLRRELQPTFNISNLPASVDEGQSISPIIGISSEFVDLVPNISVNAYWEISGVGIASTDFEDVGQDGNPDAGTTLTGYVSVTGNNASKQFAIGIRSDSFTDLNVNETATFSVYSDAARTQLVDSDTFIINDTSMGEPQFDFLLVGGGGGGGYTAATAAVARCAGGGGAGGVLVVSNEPIAVNDVIYCEIAATAPTGSNGYNTELRQDTSGGTILHQIKGGGKGAAESSLSFSGAGSSPDPFGGSGGGGAGWYNSSRGTGGSYGNNGGTGSINGGGGGGGGYGSAGQNGTSSFISSAGNGGDGYDLSNFLSSLTGSVAGGGGGGGYHDGTNFYPKGNGYGGGGDGGYIGTAGVNASDNTGGGGGGASPYISSSGTSASYRSGGTGGSGVIYLKYIALEPLFTYSGTQTVTEHIVSSGGGNKKYQVHKLTSSGTLTRVS